MENIIYNVWEKGLFPKNGLRTTSGEKLNVIDSGKSNGNRNIFNNAKIKIGDKVWAGDVVLHSRSSDWEKEIISERSCTENVILHVTLQDDCSMLRKHGEEIHQLCLTYNCDNILQRSGKACHYIETTDSDTGIGNIRLHGILSRLLIERMEDKAMYIERVLQECQYKWEEMLFKVLVRSFGFGIQSKPFEKLASITDFTALCKHHDNLLQIEAILFGQAGLLDEESIPHYYRRFAVSNEYFNELKREFKFLENKFGLKSMRHEEWNGYSVTPHLRIARLAAIFYNQKLSLSGIADSCSIKELFGIIEHPLNGYWQSHTCFGGTETVGNKSLKPTQIEVIIINAIAPVLYVYGKHRKDFRLCEKAEDYLHTIRGEENGITRKWREAGIIATCAADSQALIQLEKSYCSRSRCHECQFAHQHLKRAIKCC